MKQRVAFFVFNLGRYGGASAQAYSLAQHLPDFDIVIFSIDKRTPSVREEQDETHPHIHLVHLPASYLRGLLVVRTYHRQRSFTLLHLHGLIALGLLASWILSIPLILKTTLRGSDDFDAIANRFYGPLLLPFLSRIRQNVVLSQALLQINRKHLSSDRVTLIPNGVHCPENIEEKSLPTFCWVGLICERKRTDKAISFFLEHYAALPEARLFIVGPENTTGDFVEGSSSYATYCRSLVPEEHKEKVVFCGELSRQDVFQIYRTSLGYISFSTHEGMPNALLEAMAYNCVPLIGTLGGVAHEIVEHGETGYIIESDQDVPSLSAIRATSQSRRIKQHMNNAFSFITIAQHYRTLYHSILQAD